MNFILLGPDRQGGMFDSLLGQDQKLKHQTYMFTAKLLGLEKQLTTFATIDGSISAKREQRSD
jgi:hypothetical protein